MLTFRERVSLKPYNTLALEAHCRYFVEINQPQQVPAAIDFATQNNIPFLMLGGGSNIVFTQDFSGLVIKNNLKSIVSKADGDHFIVTAAAGENWHQLVLFCCQQGYYGLENLALIPGSVGAAPIQNIGAYGVELAQLFYQLEGYDCALHQWRTLTVDDCNFGYRDSVFKQELHNQFIITSVSLRLNSEPSVHTYYAALNAVLAQQNTLSPSPQQIINAVISLRQSKLPDPKQLANVGSFFKNPVISSSQAEALLNDHPDMVVYPQDDGRVKLAAGWLLEQAGWKGKRQGEVGMHQQQSLVLINYANASGTDVLALAQRIQDEVLTQFGITLDIEPSIV